MSAPVGRDGSADQADAAHRWLDRGCKAALVALFLASLAIWMPA